MANLGSAWTETIPSDASIVGHEPPHLRSVWTSIGLGLGTNLFWPESGGGSQASLGDLRPGGSRAFYDTASNSSSADTTRYLARAFLASDTSRLFVYESDRTLLAGTPYLIEHGTAAGRGVWVETRGTEVVPSGSVATINFGIVYDATPTTVFTTFSQRSFSHFVSTLTAGGFVSSFSFTGPGSQSTVTIFWTSTGTIGGAV